MFSCIPRLEDWPWPKVFVQNVLGSSPICLVTYRSGTNDNQQHNNQQSVVFWTANRPGDQTLHRRNFQVGKVGSELKRLKTSISWTFATLRGLICLFLPGKIGYQGHVKHELTPTVNTPSKISDYSAYGM